MNASYENEPKSHPQKKMGSKTISPVSSHSDGSVRQSRAATGQCSETEATSCNVSSGWRRSGTVPTRPLNPYADLEMADGRRFRIAEIRAYEAQNRGTWGGQSGEQRTEGNAPRWEVELEVQGDGRGDNFAFRVCITWAAVRRGELERVGYGRRCDRPTAILLLARESVWHHLQSHRHPPRYSAHAWPIRLLVE